MASSSLALQSSIRSPQSLIFHHAATEMKQERGCQRMLAQCTTMLVHQSDFLGQKFVSGKQHVESGLVCKVTKKSQKGHLVSAKIRKTKKAPMDPEYPWPSKYSADDQGFLAWLSQFRKQAPKSGKPMSLPFEKELVDIEKKMAEVKRMASSTGMDFSEQIGALTEKYNQLKRDIYTRLTPIQRLSVARHPNRPTFLDHVHVITDKWVELHGDRAGYDDPALVCGLGIIDGKSFMLMGHQKGRNTKENIYRNFGMPSPYGYRKALRFMRHADKFGFPIITFVDTPGAYAGVTAEELGQGEAIAMNLREMYGLSVPTIAVVIGEGGSGGALAIGCCNKMLMLENSVYYVASPEACAAILWKTAAAAPKATEMLRITGQELCKLNIVDEVISEPVGGAHTNPVQASLNLKTAVMKHMNELLEMEQEEIFSQRIAKFRQIGGFVEGVAVKPKIQRKMKKTEATGSGDLLMVPARLHSEPKSVKLEVNATPVNSSIGRAYDP